jgi:uncharacterized protein YfaS (alpha-2-macroglobulin family)
MSSAKLLLLFCLLPLLIQCDSSTEESDLAKYKDYIYSHTQGEISIADPVVFRFVNPVKNKSINQELDPEILEFKPKVEGKLYLSTDRNLIFSPKEHLKPGQTYEGLLHLDKLYPSIESGYKNYSFTLSTIEPDFKVSLEALESYDKEWSYRNASIETSDLVPFEDVKKIVTAAQSDKQLSIKWSQTNETATYFRFKIDSIKRSDQESTVQLNWNGSPINAENKGENSFVIPAKDVFKVLDITTEGLGSPKITVNFSQTLQNGQSLIGLIQINEDRDLNFDIEGNNLIVYPKKAYNGAVTLQILKNIKSIQGKSLKADFKEKVLFNQSKPSIRLITEGVILPNSTENPFYFEATGLKAVDVRIIKIYENNVLQFLQDANLDDSNNYRLRNVGRVVARKTIPLVQNKLDHDGFWKAYAIDLNQLFKADPGALYQVDISFRPELSLYSCDDSKTDYTFTSIEEDTQTIEREEDYWDYQRYDWRNYRYNWRERDNPCDDAYYNQNRFLTANILASDLGLLVKKTKTDVYHIYTSNLLSAQPEGSVNIAGYNYQMQEVSQVSTNAQGMAQLKSNKNIAFVVAQKNNQYAYLKLNKNQALSLSNFDVGGSEIKKGLKGYIYTERGVYRPGDTIYTGFVLNDLANPIPENYPIKLKLTDARGKLVYDETQLQGLNKVYTFSLPTKATDPTGNWNAEINIGAVTFNKRIKVAAVKPNRLKIKLDFEDDVLPANEPINAVLTSNWLSGATARKLKAEVEMNMSIATHPFPKLKTYSFYDITRSFNDQEMDFFKGKLNDEGLINIQKNIETSQNLPGMLKLSFLTKVYENGGDFSINVTQKNLAPFEHFVGLRSPDIKGRTYDTDEETLYRVISVDKSGKPVASKPLKAYIYRLDWRWWWNRGSDNLSKYQNSSSYRAYKSFDLTTDARGMASFKLNIPQRDRGRYLIRVIDEKGKHAASQIAYYYKNWWTNTEGNLANMLVFNLDKDQYNVGETAKVTFPSSQGAKALLTVENGSGILSQEWVETQSGTTTLDLKITEEFTPNAYVSLSFIQPHQRTENDRPIRLFGVVPLKVENQDKRLSPELNVPEKIRPETSYNIQVTEQNGKPMTYTIAVVDEGLLDLTNFSVPDIYEYFNRKEALGVQTFDIYDDVIGAYAGSVENIFSIGGGGSLAGSKNRKANRFKPVVSFIGPFELKAGESKKHKLYMPNYIGSVKVMLVASDVASESYGSVEEVVPVKKPLMLLASVPRKLSPGEKLSIPLTVFAMEDEIKKVTLTAEVSSGIKPVGPTEQTLSFMETGDKIVNFDYEVVSSSSIENLKFTATSGRETAKYTLEIDTYNPNPMAQKTKNFELGSNESLSIDEKSFGTKGTNSAFVEISALPPMDLSKRLSRLIGYPHGCVEQTTSKAFPQIYLEDIADLSFSQKEETKRNVQKAIEKLNDFQLVSGGLSYWPGGSANEWGTSYAGHFMIEAQRKGFNIPMMFLNNWKNFQKEQARRWNENTYSRPSDYMQAYRLYTLALLGDADLASMNRLRNTKISNASKWRLAQAYALIGQKDVAKSIVESASIYEVYDPYQYYTYGSDFRNQAMLLESLVYLEDDRMQEKAENLALKLSSDDYLNTQETAFALVSLSKLLQKNGGKAMDINFNGESVKTNKPILKRDIKLGENAGVKLKLKNNKDTKLFVRLVQNGKPALGESFAEQKNLSLNIAYTDANGKPMNINEVRQGSEVNVTINIGNLSQTDLRHLALQYHLPSGWEVVDTSFTDYQTDSYPEANYVDIRDSEIHFYLDLDAKKTKSFSVKMNASYLGEYFLPGSQAETMYSNAYFARTKDSKVKVLE